MDQEGVTKFDLCFTPGPPPPSAWLADLNAWRAHLYEAQLIGEDPARYDGIGFGNVSCRVPAGERGLFVISGTQTGGRPALTANDYTLVTAFDLAANRLEASGPVAPSSESLTHAMLYSLDPLITHVFHVHSPDIWRAARRLGIPVTPADAAYGTPAMAEAAGRLYAAGRLANGLFAMGGHVDGVVGFGTSADHAGRPLIAALARARSFPLSEPDRL